VPLNQEFNTGNFCLPPKIQGVFPWVPCIRSLSLYRSSIGTFFGKTPLFCISSSCVRLTCILFPANLPKRFSLKRKYLGPASLCQILTYFISRQASFWSDPKGCHSCESRNPLFHKGRGRIHGSAEMTAHGVKMTRCSLYGQYGRTALFSFSYTFSM
jgi:hypothetical protein